MAEKQDYYQLLGIARNAGETEIKKAYRQLALKFHPDRNPGDKQAEQKFKEINEAYEVISDPKKRAAYDQYGHAGVSSSAASSGGGFEGFQDFTSGVFGDLFSDIFGESASNRGNSRRGGSQRGEDLQVNLPISLHDAAFGSEHPLEIYRLENCSVCKGSGAKSGMGLKTCPQCKGAGQIKYARGFFSFAQTCNRCQGEGSIMDNPCPTCNGNGVARQRAKINVRIPAGVENGTSLRVRGEGNSGRRSGSKGDLYVVISTIPDPNFVRQGDNLLYEAEISMVQAALGCEIEVPTLEGKATLKIPASTQTGTTFRIREKGIPHLNARGRGDQLVKIAVKVPRNLNDRQKALLIEFARLSGEDVSSYDPSLIKKIFAK